MSARRCVVVVEWNNMLEHVERAFRVQPKRETLCPYTLAERVARKSARGAADDLVAAIVVAPRARRGKARRLLEDRDQASRERHPLLEHEYGRYVTHPDGNTEPKGVYMMVGIAAAMALRDQRCDVVALASHNAELAPVAERFRPERIVTASWFAPANGFQTKLSLKGPFWNVSLTEDDYRAVAACEACSALP